MKLYKSTTGEIWAYEEDGSQDHLIPSNFVLLTQAEIDAREKQFAVEQEKFEAEMQAQKQAKNSALAKLAALGLTQDEVKSLLD
jgi:Tfp pilus assembly protein FimV